MGKVAKLFFDNNWIDYKLRKGKRGGAFSHSCVPSVHPYILMNFTGKIRDVMTLAHELGHGIHQYLSRKNGYFQQNTPLTTAETASVFAEMLVFTKLIEILYFSDKFYNSRSLIMSFACVFVETLSYTFSITPDSDIIYVTRIMPIYSLPINFLSPHTP